MEESSIYGGKNLIRKIFLLRVMENPSCRNSSYGRNKTWKRFEFFSGNMNSLRVMENSSYRRSSHRSSTVLTCALWQSGRDAALFISILSIYSLIRLNKKLITEIELNHCFIVKL
jgi:hypothetical protein